MIREFNEIRQQDIDTDIRKQREEALKQMRQRTQDEIKSSAEVVTRRHRLLPTRPEDRPLDLVGFPFLAR